MKSAEELKRSAGVRRRKNEAKDTLQQTQGDTTMIPECGKTVVVTLQEVPVSAEGHEGYRLQMAEDLRSMRRSTELMLAVGLIIEGFKDIVFNEPASMHQVQNLLRRNGQILTQDPEISVWRFPLTKVSS